MTFKNYILPVVFAAFCMNASADMKDFAADFMRHGYEAMSDEWMAADELPRTVDVRELSRHESTAQESVKAEVQEDSSNYVSMAEEDSLPVLSQREKPAYERAYDIALFAGLSLFVVDSSKALLYLIQGRIENKRLLDVVALWMMSYGFWKYVEHEHKTVITF